MSWLFLAIASRFLWAWTNLIDQYVVRYVAGRSALVVLMLENLIILPTIIVYLCINGIPEIKPASFLWLMISAPLNMLALVPYFTAVRDDEAHNAIPIWELTPVILTFLAWIVFGDTLNKTQLLGAALVISAGFLISWDFEKNRIRLRTLLLMSLSSLCYAVYQLALRYGAQNKSVWNVMFCIWVGNFVSALVLFVVLPKQRRLFLDSIAKSHGKIIAIAAGEECLAMSGVIALVSAFALAPKVGQVAALSATQPIFVLIISALLGSLVPKHFSQLTWNRSIQIKCLLLLVIAGGVVLLKS